MHIKFTLYFYSIQYRQSELIKARSHFHEFLCEWSCERKIYLYSHGHAFSQEFSIFPCALSFIRMPCDSHATPMRSSLCVLCVLCELRKTSVRIPCDLCTCSATPMRVPCDQSECQTTPARLLLDLAESYKGGTSAWIFITACDVRQHTSF